MVKYSIPAALIALIALSGCARLSSNESGPLLQLDNGNGVISTADAISATKITGFIDPAVSKVLSDKDQAEAASAQYYALQFGRTGAPRTWQGDTGAQGRISVGPYVRVNTLNCRDFSHVVAVEKSKFERSGTACREADGGWKVVDS